MAFGRESRRETKREAGRSARSQPPGKSGPEWWVERWQRWATELGLVAAGAESAARIKRMEIGQGSVAAVVQDRNQSQCQIEIQISPWSETQWQAALDAIAGQAHFAAQMAGGELPPEADAMLAEAGAPLLPQHLKEIEIRCQGDGCSDGNRGPCRHAAMVFAQLGAALADDPWLLMRMRGRDQAQVLAALRKPRPKTAEVAAAPPQSVASQGSARFHRNSSDNATPEDTPALTAQTSQFWGVTKALEGYRPHFIEPKVDAVLLRRLGPLPFSAADDDIYEDLAAIYRRVSAEALRQAFAPDTDGDS